MANSGESPETVRAAVFLASEQDRKRAEGVLGELEREGRTHFGGMVEGELSPAQVKQLDAEGLVVELVEHTAAPPPEALGGARRAIAAGSEVIEELQGQAPEPRTGGLEPSEAEALPVDAYNLELEGPITRAQRLELDKLGVDIAAYEPGYGYRTVLDHEQYAKVQALPYVAAVRRYRFSQTMTPELLEAVTDGGEGEEPQLLSGGEEEEAEDQVFDCLLHREEDLAKVRKLITGEAGTEVLDSSNLRIRFGAKAGVPLLATLAVQPEVRQLSVYEAPTL
jgi:hypothetical protein